MSWWRRLQTRWGGGVARFESVERDIRAEMQIHIEMRVADNLAAGMPAAAARHDAEARFGNVERIVRLGREI